MGSRDKQSCSNACFLMSCIDFALIALAFVSVIVLIFTGAVVMREHLASRDFLPARCSYVGEHDHGRKSCRYCTSTETGFGKHRRTRQECVTSYYQCIQIEVEYEDALGIRRIGNLYKDSLTQLAQANEQRCSYQICGRNEEHNTRTVENFVSPWRTVRAPSTASCFYDPEDTNQVISVKVYTYTEALHSVLWPTGFFFLALICLIGRCCFRYYRSKD